MSRKQADLDLLQVVDHTMEGSPATPKPPGEEDEQDGAEDGVPLQQQHHRCQEDDGDHAVFLPLRL
jgi:hypothetical protein